MNRFVLSMLRFPNKKGPFDWLLFLLALAIIIPLLILMLLLLPLMIIYQLIKAKFYPASQDKTLVTPIGIMVVSPHRGSQNIPWHEVECLEKWSEDGKILAVLMLKSGAVVKLAGKEFAAIQQQCVQRGITVNEEEVIIAEVVD